MPVSLLLNEAHTLEHGLRGVDAGFDAVMLCTDASERRRARVAELARVAHARGVAVEGELGTLPDGGRGRLDATRRALTDPSAAAAFVAATGVDALAVSIGNVHTLEGRVAPVDLERLDAIQRAVEVPLVVHGGTGFPADAVPAAIERGVAKFNVGTVLKRAYLDGLARGPCASGADECRAARPRRLAPRGRRSRAGRGPIGRRARADAPLRRGSGVAPELVAAPRSTARCS